MKHSTIKQLKLLLSSLAIFCLVSNTQAQEGIIVDEVVAVVGDKIILQSEITDRVAQVKQELKTYSVNECEILEQMLLEKLMLNQAGLDSISASEQQIQGELDRRMRYFINQLGSEKRLEEYYNKSITELKAEFHDMLSDQMSIQAMQGEITKNVKITPAEVETFFNNIPSDSIPLIDEEIEMAQILIKPQVNTKENNAAKQKLEDFRTKIMSKELDFASVAVLYSEDPGSATNGGDLGMQAKGTFVPEFDAVAFALQDGEVSTVFKSQFGYHLMQMVERRGQKYRARHILIKPKVQAIDLQNAKAKADSILAAITAGTLTFEKAAEKFSSDDQSKNNEGLIMNQASGTPRFNLNEIEPQMFFVVDKLNEGEVSKPAVFTSPQGEQSYRLVKLIERKEAHKANLKDDYNVILNAASQERRNVVIRVWTAEKIETTYLKLDDDKKSCDFEYHWVK